MSQIALNAWKSFADRHFLAKVYCAVVLIAGLSILGNVHPSYLYAIIDFSSTNIGFALWAVLSTVFLIKLSRRDAWFVPCVALLFLVLGSVIVVNQCLPAAVPLDSAGTAHGNLTAVEVPYHASTKPSANDAMARANFFGWNNASLTFTNDGETDSLIPTSVYQFKLLSYFPSVTPTWTGDFIVHPDSRVEWLNAVQATRDPRLQGVPVYPRELAEWKFLNYSVNTAPRLHEVGDTQLMQTDGGLTWVIFSSPNDGSDRLRGLFLVNARTGATRWQPLADGPAVPNVAGLEIGVTSSGGIALATPGENGYVVHFQGIDVRSGVLFWHWVRERGDTKLADIWFNANTKDIQVTPAGVDGSPESGPSIN